MADADLRTWNCKRAAFIAIFLLIWPSAIIRSQACSCGGAPLLGSLEQPAVGAGVWQSGLTYEYISIADVISVSTSFDDNDRQRTVHSALLEINYGLTDRFTISALMSLLQQERETTSLIGSGDFLRTRGVGDAVVMLKYNLVPYTVHSRRQVSIGLGSKIPFGKTGLTRNGTLISADMQPGTGSWDGIAWGLISQGFSAYWPAGIHGTMSYKFNGTNDRFGLGQRGYRFGDELIGSVGLTLSPTTLIDFSLSMRYRRVDADQFGGIDQPNSGGRWWNIAPALRANLSPKLSVRASSQIPVYRRVSGIQLTTDYVLSLSLQYSPDRATSTLNF